MPLTIKNREKERWKRAQ